MKVLVIGLLRLGDFIQILPVIHGLRAQNSIRQLDVLTFEPTKSLQPMLPVVDQWWTLNRDDLQRGLGEGNIPMLTSFSVLQEQLDTINAQKYDAVINLTQTRFSAWIAGYLHTGNRTGLALDPRGNPHFHSPWFQYLDEHTPLNVKDIFHYTDIFFYGCGLKGSERQWWMKETTTGQLEVDELSLPAGENIVLQVFTSDDKKTWPAESWLRMLTQLRLFRSKANLVLLGAPNEAERLRGLASQARERGLRVTEAILSMQGAFSLLKRAQLLISGDTSIKHLANAADIPVLELSLGSSDFRRTGAYRANALIVQAKVRCAPCPHSSPCSQDTHECAAVLSPEIVSTSAHHMLSGDWFALRKLAQEFFREARFLRTRMVESGFWFAADLLGSKPEVLLDTLVERCTWKFLLSREYLNPLAQFGSEGVRLCRELESLLPSEALTHVNGHLNFLESETAQRSEKLAHMWQTARQAPAPDRGITQIGDVRKMHAELEKVFHQAQVKLKLIRSLKSQLSGAK